MVKAYKIQSRFREKDDTIIIFGIKTINNKNCVTEFYANSLFSYEINCLSFIDVGFYNVDQFGRVRTKLHYNQHRGMRDLLCKIRTSSSKLFIEEVPIKNLIFDSEIKESFLKVLLSKLLENNENI